MNEGTGLYLQKRPAGGRRLFSDYGIAAEPTPETIQIAYGVFGKPFIGDPVNAFMPKYDSAEGDALQANADRAEQKKTLFENIVDVLNGTAAVLTGWGLASGKGSSAVTPTPIVIQGGETQKNSTWLFLGIGLAAVILLTVIIIVKRKK